jgi:hypothetical protein
MGVAKGAERKTLQSHHYNLGKATGWEKPGSIRRGHYDALEHVQMARAYALQGVQKWDMKHIEALHFQ